MSKPDMPVRAYVGLGGNVGGAEETLRAAIRTFDALPSTRLVGASRLYRTPAWGRVEQPDFVNAVAAIDTTLAPRALLDALLGIERAHGRERNADAERWGPRTLDLDLLLYGDAVIDELGLHVPHPHLHERAFVLVPLCEIAPEAVIPGIDPARDILAAMATDGIEALG
jgi:2-amino-4-hydroxy-6-hydroxymethyldihydropteridine diphosphokinase